MAIVSSDLFPMVAQQTETAQTVQPENIAQVIPITYREIALKVHTRAEEQQPVIVDHVRQETTARTQGLQRRAGTVRAGRTRAGTRAL